MPTPAGWISTSADAKIIDALLDTPIFSADTAQQITGTADVSRYRALGRLIAAGVLVLEVFSESKRNRIWAAVDVLAELDALSTTTIGKRATEPLQPQPAPRHRSLRAVAATTPKRWCRPSVRIATPGDDLEHEQQITAEAGPTRHARRSPKRTKGKGTFGNSVGVKYRRRADYPQLGLSRTTVGGHGGPCTRGVPTRISRHGVQAPHRVPVVPYG
ncbi:hypothetical protein G352_22331 [Rhodococcus ruber BKS 20-38]|uniref:Uncharacterized protein n=1 Tax=Rhodococcus ruber BKS 20-38 TaxID=1278076 RepID=M2Z565_9NOCA|nr:hypothetical protein [Rhodococcus ruber]EME55998.1 hypothetical protein G352_22331 [Rhodococcus ruber BKS 20-38]